MSLKAKVLHVIQSSPVALSVREICCTINEVDPNYCLNIDGKGTRCVYWFRRPRHEKQRIRLGRPKCKYDAFRIIRVLLQLEAEKKVKKMRIHLRDELSAWGFDNFRLVYVNISQVNRRLKTNPLV